MTRSRFGAVLAIAIAACGDEPEAEVRLRAAPPSAAAAAAATARGRVSGTGTLGLRVREAPTTASAQVGTVDEGTSVTVLCRVEGEVIDGNKFWDRIAEEGGGYVADAFIDMSDAEQGIARCEGAAAVPTAAATVDVEGPAVRAHVQLFADDACRLEKACRASTYRGHQPSADLALDLPSGEGYGKLPTDGHAFGDRLAEHAVANRAQYRIAYVIYRQRINLGTGWEPMEDRGSITQNHFDHVHVSFEP